MGYIDMVELDGLVEVPLFERKQFLKSTSKSIQLTQRMPKKPKIQKKCSKPSFFKLDLSSNIIAVDDAFVQANGLDVKNDQ